MGKILGDNSAILVQKHLHWDKSNGYDLTEVYSGPEQAAMAKANSLIGTAVEVDCSRAGDGSRFEAVIKYDRNPVGGSPDDSVNTDELLTNQESQSILLSPTLAALIPVSVMSVITAQHEKVSVGQTTYSAATGEITAACLAASISNANALAVFDDLIRGRINYYTDSHIYRRTLTVSSLSAIVAAFTNANMIHTTAQMRNAENTPNGFPLPDGLWRKLKPTVIAALRQRTQITYSYEWALDWPALYYDYVV